LVPLVQRSACDYFLDREYFGGGETFLSDQLKRIKPPFSKSTIKIFKVNQ
jgi:hypothetical protein